MKFVSLQIAAHLQSQSVAGQSLVTGGWLLIFEVEKEYFWGQNSPI